MFQALAPCQSDWRNCGLCEGLYAENRAMLLVGIWWWENKNKLIEWKALVDTVGNNSTDLWGKKVCSTVWQLSIYRFVEVWMLFLTQTYSRSLRVTYGPPEESDMRQEQVTTLANNLRNSGGDVEIGPCGELWWMFIFDKLWEVHGIDKFRNWRNEVKSLLSVPFTISPCISITRAERFAALYVTDTLVCISIFFKM